MLLFKSKNLKSRLYYIQEITTQIYTKLFFYFLMQMQFFIFFSDS